MQIEIKQELAFGHRWPVAELRAALSGARKTVLVAHLNADGDAVGSVAGMAAALRLTTTGRVTSMLPDGVPDDLRWLPGADHAVTTRTETTLRAVDAALTLLKPQGLMTVCVYPGHEEGARELKALTEWARQLDSKIYDALLECYMNQPNDPPQLIAVKKKG